MPIVTDGPMMAPERGIHELAASFGQSIGATAAESWADSPMSQLMTGSQIAEASGDMPDFGKLNDNTMGGVALTEEVKPAVPRMDIIEANDRVKKAGLDKHLTLPDQPDIPPAQLTIMMRNAQARAEREATIERGPQGFIPSALQVGTSFLVGAADPINVASAFIPIMGELRYGKVLAAAGDSLTARLATRAAVGAGQGAVGQAALEPLDWWAHTQEGRDFGMSDVLHNIMFGAALGGGLHAVGGLAADIYRNAKGRPLYPFGPGEPLGGIGTHISGDALADTGIHIDDLPDHLQPVLGRIEDILGQPNVSPPVRVVQDLPPRAHEDSMRAAIAALVSGEPVKAGEMLQAAAATDPRIAESFEAFHGSPHDFERFTLAKLGTGEGAQVYGHGLYFAENEATARDYQRTTSNRDFIRKAQELYDQFDHPDDAHEAIAQSEDFTPGQKRLLQALEKDDWLGFDYPHQAVQAALSKKGPSQFDMSPETLAAIRDVGQVYKVRIAADREHFLDWDKPLSEQPEVARRAQALFDQLGRPENVSRDYATGRELAEDLFHNLNTPDEGARLLSEAGIPGVKYLDQGSRKAGEGTRNFVVFDDKHIEITHKNGEPVRQDNLPPRLHAVGADARNWPELPVGARIVGQGDNGPVLGGFQGRWREAVDWLRQAQTGDAIGVLEHPDVSGRIDLIWGDERHGLAHIDGKHPGDADQLPMLWKDLKVVRQDRKFIELQSDVATAVIARDYAGSSKDWLLTFFERRKPGEGDVRPAGETVRGPSDSGPAAQSPASPHEGNLRLEGTQGKRAARGRAAADPQTWSLFELLAHEGGLKPDPELAAIFGNAKGPFVPGFGALVRPKGRPLDDALRLAKDHGYMFDAADVTGAEGRLTPNDLLDRIAEENAGRKQYRNDQQYATKTQLAADLEREKHEIIAALHDEIEAATGQKGVKIDPALEDRVVQIVQREGEHDVLGAYERAIMEDAERYEGLSNERRQHQETAHIPGWDVDEPAGASADGRPAAGERGQAGLPDQGPGRADGSQPRNPGAGDRGQISSPLGPAKLDHAADWRAIAHVTPDFDTPDAIAASNAAAKVEPPKTKLDERVTAAENADAFAKQMYDMFAHRLPEEERTRLEERLAELDRQKADADTVSQRGAACLFEGRGA